MACSTASRPEMENWTPTFPSELNALVGSGQFMKRLMAIAVSAITYMRAMFPEDAYGVRRLADMDLKILSESTSCLPACQVISWMKSAFEALDLKYLRVMMLGIHDTPGDHDNVIESYIFRFTYTNGVSITCNGVEISNATGYDKQITRRTTVSLLRTLLLLSQTLEPLPPSYYVTMKLLYYDDITPPKYEPTGFVPAATDTFYFKGEPLTVRIGCVSTPFHSLKLNIKSDKAQFNIREEEPMPSGSIQLQSSGQTDNTLSFSTTDSLHNSADGKDYTIDNPDECQNVDPSNYVNMENGVNAAGVVEEISVIRCPCGSEQEEGLMIQCHKCEYWQHGVCFGAIEEADAPEIHLCDLCYKSGYDGFEPKDRDFYELSAISLQALCLWRRALLCVCDMKTVQPTALAKSLETKRSVATNIIKRMEDEGYITMSGTGRKKARKYVNQQLIKEHGIPKYILGTIKDISDDKDVEVEELNEGTDSIYMTSAPEFTTYGLFGHGKDFKTSDGEGPRGCGEEVQKHNKASTCKSGIASFCNQNE